MRRETKGVREQVWVDCNIVRHGGGEGEEKGKRVSWCRGRQAGDIMVSTVPRILTPFLVIVPISACCPLPRFSHCCFRVCLDPRGNAVNSQSSITVLDRETFSNLEYGHNLRLAFSAPFAPPTFSESPLHSHQFHQCQEERQPRRTRAFFRTTHAYPAFPQA